eukprot:4151946-Pyramimonas_sp.AAC.1
MEPRDHYDAANTQCCEGQRICRTAHPGFSLTDEAREYGKTAGGMGFRCVAYPVRRLGSYRRAQGLRSG